MPAFVPAALLAAAGLLLKGGAGTSFTAEQLGAVSFDPGGPGAPPAPPWKAYPSSKGWGPNQAKTYLIQTHAPRAAAIYYANKHLWPKSAEDIHATVRLLAARFNIPAGCIARTIRLESGSNFRILGACAETSSAWGAGAMTKDTAETAGVDYLDCWWWPLAAWCIPEVFRKYGWHTKGAAHAIGRYRGGDATMKAKRVADVLGYQAVDPSAILKWYPENAMAEYENGKKYDPWYTVPRLWPWREGVATQVNMRGLL